MSAEVGEVLDLEHVVPTHLNTPDRVGLLTVRQLNALLAPAMFVSPGGWLLGQPAGLMGSAALAAVPVLAGGVFALPFTPPAEHGLRKLVEFAFRPKTIAPSKMQAFTRVREAGADGVVRLTWKRECRAIWQLPSTNLRLAHTLQKRAAITRWARFLDGLTCPVQVVVRATPVDLEPVLRRIERRRTAEAARLAGFLRVHASGSGLVQRERYLVVGADDEDQLADRVRSIEDSLARAGLQPRRVRDEPGRKHVVADLLRASWSSSAATEIGPQTLRINAQAVRADAEHCRTVARSCSARGQEP